MLYHRLRNDALIWISIVLRAFSALDKPSALERDGRGYCPVIDGAAIDVA